NSRSTINSSLNRGENLAPTSRCNQLNANNSTPPLVLFPSPLEVIIKTIKIYI
ncbi:LOW QUALITY PROTEIN: hypothetical protein PanWU01x14_128400, partial [Parasponia andersonii]